MSIDKAKLDSIRKKAEEASAQYSECTAEGLEREFDPEFVLALLAEFKRLEEKVRLADSAAEMMVHDTVARAVTGAMATAFERDNLKAMVKSLRAAQRVLTHDKNERAAFEAVHPVPKGIFIDDDGLYATETIHITCNRYLGMWQGWQSRATIGLPLLVVPERLPETARLDFDGGWNACLDEFAKLNELKS